MRIKKTKILKIKIFIILIGFLMSCTIMIITTPIHETAHLVLFEVDPFIEPVEIKFFDYHNPINEQNILHSNLGYIIIKEKYPGSLNERFFWIEIIQEIICYSIQLIIAIWISLKTIILICKKYPSFTYRSIKH